MALKKAVAFLEEDEGTKNGAPELVQAVEQGKIAVSTAAAITQLPKEEQKRVSVTREVKSVKQNSAPWRFRQEFYRIGVCFQAKNFEWFWLKISTMVCENL